jgi:phage terminase large subunit GpA-like protein
MLLGGEWRPDHPEREDGREYGYHLNTLYAPGGWSSVSWGALAEQWERGKGDPEAVKVYVNTIDGETYDETEDATTDPETLQGRAEVYARPVPDGVRVLTAGVDVQQDRVEVEVVGWGDGEESWSIDFVALPGDPTGPQLWADLDDYLRRRWDGYGIAAVCVDSGYMAQQVQDWCYHRRGRTGLRHQGHRWRWPSALAQARQRGEARNRLEGLDGRRRHGQGCALAAMVAGRAWTWLHAHADQPRRAMVRAGSGRAPDSDAGRAA